MEHNAEFEDVRFGLNKIEYFDLKKKLDFLKEEARLIDIDEYKCLALAVIRFKKKSKLRIEIVKMIDRMYGSEKVKGSQERLSL